MRFMLLMVPRVYQPDTPLAEQAGDDFTPPAHMVERMMEFNEGLANAGVLVALDGLHPLSTGARVKFAGGEPTVTDGKSAKAREVIGGYWIIDVKSKQEAIDWVKRCPAQDGDVVEIRQLFEIAEFPAEVQQAVAGSEVTRNFAGRGRNER